MSITWAANVAVIAPELASVAAAQQTLILATVERIIDGDVWGDFADDGRTYLAAHLGTVSSSGSGAGPVTEESIGPFRRSYASPTDESGLGTTKYGVFYLQLLRMAVAVPAMVP